MRFANTLSTLADGLAGFSDWANPKIIDVGGLGDFLFFRAILRFLSERINEFGLDLMARVMSFIGLLALVVLTLYVLIQGYRVLTGQMRESLMGVVANMAKAAFIVAFAVAFGTVGTQTHRYLTQDLKNGIHRVVTNSNTTPEEKIDESLGWMSVAMSTMDALDLQGDPELISQKEKAEFFMGLGTGGPAVVAGSMLLLYQIALALFIGLGPLFILCLLFESTKSLFQRWLLYGIGTMFSMAVLSFMVSLALDMVTRVAIAMWTSAALGQLLLGENVVGGMNSMAMQQGGMGLILTTLILTAPPMAAMFFNGTLGQFAAYATMGAHLAPGQGQPQRGAYSESAPPYVPNQVVRDESVRSPTNTSSDSFRQSTPTFQTGSLGAQSGEQSVRQGSALRDSRATQPDGPMYQPPPPPKDRT